MVTISARNTNIYKICKLRKAIFSVFYNISQPIFAILREFAFLSRSKISLTCNVVYCFCIQVTTEPDGVKQRDLWITDFVPMQNIYKLVLAMTSKEIGKNGIIN
jgi:hypothetical protein